MILTLFPHVRFGTWRVCLQWL